MSPGTAHDASLPHDLLWIAGVEDLAVEEPLPGWVSGAMAQVPVVVVRRASCRDGLIPVGCRGGSREERFAATVAAGRVRKRLSPEEIRAQRRWREVPRRDVPALGALEAIARQWEALEWPWGPTGSVGFELATGVPAARPGSDLDLLIRAREPLSRRDAVLLVKAADHLGAAVDIQMETPFGAVALREFAAPSSKWLLMKRSIGPALVMDPWNAEEGVCP
jgi:phosphoribosyl-dephospho-CoA transferase